MGVRDTISDIGSSIGKIIHPEIYTPTGTISYAPNKINPNIQKNPGYTSVNYGGGGYSSGEADSNPVYNLDSSLADLQAQQEIQRQIDAQQKLRDEQARQEAQRQAQIQQQRLIAAYQQQQGHQTIPYIPPVNNAPYYVQPTIVNKQVGTYQTGASNNYRNIPIGEWKVVNPQGEDLGNNVYRALERGATPEEIALYSTSVLQASEQKPTAIAKITGGYASNLGDVYSNVNTRLRETITENPINSLYGVINYTPGQDLSISGIPEPINKVGEFVAGAGLGILEDIRVNPLNNAILYGASLGVGGAVKGATYGLSQIPKAGKYLGITAKVGSEVGGAYLGGSYLMSKANAVYFAPTPAKKGEIIGVGLKDVALMGGGFAKGQETFTQLKGLYQTRGREFLEVKQGEYPQAPANKQLSLFQKNVIKELGSTPGAFHTTPSKFWNSGIIEAQAGTSELPGLYASTQISTPFAKIQGSGSNYKLFPSIKDLLSVEGKPAVAYLKPKGFRYSPFEKVTPYKIGEQTFRYDFKNPVKQGWADVPGMKSEIESIFRVGSGGYGFESGSYYTKIKNVRVPIDVFSYKGKSETSLKNDLFGSSKYSSYELPPSYALLTPESFGASYLSKSKSSAPKTYPSYSFLEPTSKVSSVSRSSSSNLYSSGYLSSISKTSSISSVVGLSKSSKRGQSYSFLYGGGGSSRRIQSYPYSIPARSTGGFWTTPKQRNIPKSIFNVQIRRRGKFLNVGSFSSYNDAWNKGLSSVSKNLARSFRISGTPRAAILSNRVYQSRKEPGVFIQKARYSLSAPTEKSEIKFFRNLLSNKQPRVSRRKKKSRYDFLS